MNERDEPMKGLADWLRASASIAECDYPTAANSGTTLRRWAAEVEASRQRSAVGAEVVAEVTAYGDTIKLRRHLPVGTKLYAAPSERPAAPAQAGVTDAMKTAIEAMEDSLEDAQIAQGEYDGRTYNFCTSCGADDLQTPVIGKHNPRCAWTKVRAAVAALKSALLAGTPPAQSDTAVDLDGMTQGGPQAVTALRDVLGVEGQKR